MVDLPGGAKMKSREGTTVDTDDLMDEVVQKAADTSQKLDKIADLTEAEKAVLFEQIGIGAMKYFILKVQPQKRMIFDPAQSIDLIGHTGPFIQYANTRIQSLLQKVEEDIKLVNEVDKLETVEKNIIKLLDDYPAKIKAAAKHYDPSEIANYAYDLAKAFNKLWAELPILNETVEAAKQFRLLLCQQVISLPNKM